MANLKAEFHTIHFHCKLNINKQFRKPLWSRIGKLVVDISGIKAKFWCKFKIFSIKNSVY